MASLKEIAGYYADEIRDGIAWLIVWKTGRSWHAWAAWLKIDDDTFESDDLEKAREILAKDPNAVILNGYYCGHFGEDMTVDELAAGIRWHYENGYNTLDGSTAFPPEPMPRPADLPDDIPWYGKMTSEEPNPYVFDGYMSAQDYERMHELMAADVAELKSDEALTQEQIERISAAAEILGQAFRRIADACRSVMDAVLEAARQIVEAFKERWPDIEDAMIRSVATPRQYHLYKYGRPRVRKKWKNQLLKRVIKKAKQGGAWNEMEPLLRVS